MINIRMFSSSTAFTLLLNESEVTWKFSNNINKKLMLEEIINRSFSVTHIARKGKRTLTFVPVETHRMSVQREQISTR